MWIEAEHFIFIMVAQQSRLIPHIPPGCITANRTQVPGPLSVSLQICTSCLCIHKSGTERKYLDYSFSGDKWVRFQSTAYHSKLNAFLVMCVGFPKWDCYGLKAANKTQTSEDPSIIHSSFKTLLRDATLMRSPRVKETTATETDS